MLLLTSLQQQTKSWVAVSKQKSPPKIHSLRSRLYDVNVLSAYRIPNLNHCLAICLVINRCTATLHTQSTGYQIGQFRMRIAVHDHHIRCWKWFHIHLEKWFSVYAVDFEMNFLILFLLRCFVCWNIILVMRVHNICANGLMYNWLNWLSKHIFFSRKKIPSLHHHTWVSIILHFGVSLEYFFIRRSILFRQYFHA